ncbi:MAG TPA: type I 3-dehydroquinate dehydratase [Verrucomicrobiae bacterium]
MGAHLIEALQLGRVPRVVGTIITEDFLQKWSHAPSKLSCDLVELRLDGFPDFEDWIRIGKQIEHQGTPVLVTIRDGSEGGKWDRGDTQRWPLLESAIRSLSGVDVELESALVPAVAELCGQLGKLSVFSYHNFSETPPREALESKLRRAKRLEGIGKIAATANQPDDVETLRSLLRGNPNGPICVIGMGPLGRETRLQFPLEGSCFTYGYLDTPGAPGQYSAPELTKHFKNA